MKIIIAAGPEHFGLLCIWQAHRCRRSFIRLVSRPFALLPYPQVGMATDPQGQQWHDAYVASRELDVIKELAEA